MARNFDDWLKAYVEYAGFSEAPRRMHFWAGVSAIAGALRRRVWIDMGYFKWHSNHYLVFVAPPGIVSKSTTVSIAMDILRKVPGINFGPEVVTWPALVTAFATCSEQFEVGGTFHTQCALTLESSEFGNLVNPTEREMVDLLVNLWDSRQGEFKKVTKGSGTDTVVNPWINLIACTTPAWIAGNFPEYVIGGGFTSRCLFVYADTKEKYVAYPSLEIPPGLQEAQLALAADLEHIATHVVGEYSISPDAIAWGKEWYDLHYKDPPALLADERFGGYLARKQTHLHKLAMVLAASQRDTMEIDIRDLALAHTMITDLEQDMPKVFAKIGRSEKSVHAEKFIKLVQDKGPIPFSTAYQLVHTHFPGIRDFEEIVKGAVQAGYLETFQTPQGVIMIGPKKP